MVEPILAHVAQPLIAAIGGVIVALIGTHRQTKNLNEGLRALLKMTMYDKYMQAKSNGYIYVDELENFNDMYTQYVALKGNSIITGMHKRLNDGEVEIRTNETN